MSRLQKKCLVAAAGAHFLVVVVLLCSAFIPSSSRVDTSEVLDVIPVKLIDALANSGVKAAQPPPPAPPVKTPEPPPTVPEPPKPEVKQVEPPRPVEQAKPPEPTEPDNNEPEPKITKPKPHEIKVSLTPVLRKKTTETDNHEAEAEAQAAREAKRVHDQRVKALERAATSIRDNASSTTTVELRGDSTVAYANYATIVKSIYTERWILPDTAANDEANVKVSVTIARDGRVTDAHVIDRSGDSSVDNSVQRTLDRVTNLPPFPDDSTDKERTYIINFNLKAKRQTLG